ncbi:MAG: complex I NDUFA9 subunit family protein [Limisphaerales bacterium]
MNVALTGGTGFVGRALTAELVRRGHRVRRLVRHPRVGTAPAGVEEVVADLADAPALAPLLRGRDAVIHLVGIISECGAQTFESVHAGLTRAVLDAAGAAGVPRWIHMSALGARPDAASRYHRSKWAAEESVRASGLAWTILRPSLIYGPEDLFTNLLARLALLPVVPVMGSGQGLLQPIAVGQVARAFVGALEDPACAGRVYDLAGPERLTFNQVLDAILNAQGCRRLKLHLPMPLARAQASVLETVFPALLRRPPPLNRDQLLMLQEDNIGDPGPADRDFTLAHEPFAAAMRRQFTA